MDTLWLSIAFLCGLFIRLIGMPPMIGYLLAGFVLSFMGFESSGFIELISDLGIQLLLFTIGLKLKLKNLLKPEIFIGGSGHILITSFVFAGLIFTLSFSGLHIFSDLNLIETLVIAFALSFSSTVFAVKVFEDYGEVNSYHGILSIGVLIVQDIFAVLFLVIAAGKIPNYYTIGLPFVLIALKPILIYVLKKIGYGELLILFGFFAALVLGGELFDFVGLKPDLGALILGMMLANTKQTEEMSDKLLAFKDFFLIGFFLSIGMTGTPNLMHFYIAVILICFILIKSILYFVIFTRFKVRARTSFFATLSLANYSEFGLIVGAISVSMGIMSPDWLLIIAIALTLSFLITAPLNDHAHKVYSLIKKLIKSVETRERLEYDKTFDIGRAEILVFGMGRVGTAVYDHLKKRYGQKVLAIDYDLDRVKNHRKEGRNVTHDDATDIEFWEAVAQNHQASKQVKIVMLCMGNFKSNLVAINRLQLINYEGDIAAIAKHEDEVLHLQKLGIQSTFNLYAEAGIGFADHVCLNINKQCSSKIKL